MTGPGQPTTDRPTVSLITLDSLRVGHKFFERGLDRLGAYAREHAQIQMIEEGWTELATQVLADNLGQERISETVRGRVEVARFAGWWDHFKATYRGRWWMRWRRWQINYTISRQPAVARVDIDLTRYWTYPEADVLPLEEFGRPYFLMTHGRPVARWNP